MKRVLMVVILLFPACTPIGLIGKLPPVEPNHSAEIVVIYPSTRRGPATITLDGEPVIQIRAGDHTIFRIPEGDHGLGFECCPQFNVGQTYKAGERYYYVTKSGYRGYALSPITKYQAQGWLRESHYLTVDKTIISDEAK